MRKEIDNFLRNVKILCVVDGINLGDLEKEIGFNPGFFSRQAKSHAIKLETALATSAVLRVPIEKLLNEDYSPTLKEKQISEMKEKIAKLEAELRSMEDEKS